MSSPSLQIYLHDISDTPLLSAQEERELVERLAVGDPLARERMVKGNLRLVVNISRGYLGKGLDLEDLIEAGNLGLMRAVEGYDGTMPMRFSTYASYWIKQSIRGVVNGSKPIRLPAYLVSLLSRWRRASAVLTDRLGRAPTNEEVGRVLRLSHKKMSIVAKAIRVNNLSPHSENLEDSGPAPDGALADEHSQSAETPSSQADDFERIFEFLGSLEHREATLIRMRYGLGAYMPMTLREVGENLGMTRERVRQLESLALRKLMEAFDATKPTGDAGTNDNPNDPDLAAMTPAPSAPATGDAVVDENAIEQSAKREVEPPAVGESAPRPPTANQEAGNRAKRSHSRFVDPTRAERQYTAAEIEFMTALRDYKEATGRMFPTWGEVLEVLISLGYEKRTAGQSPLPDVPTVE